jgi:hypothetical protein
MDVAEWQKRLEDNFSSGGYVGSNLFEVLELEKACSNYFASTFHCQSVLIDSLQSFFIETLQRGLKWVDNNGWPTHCPSYSGIYICYLTMFRRFRACEILLLKGYPFDGYSLLRGLKDQAIIMAGIAYNLTTLTSVFGAVDIQGLSEDIFKKVTKLRMQEESKIWEKLLRKDSGLSSETITELRIWERMFHQEVHGSKLSFSTDLMKWCQGKGAPSIGPTHDETSWANYMNRAVEIGWLVVRLLPYLQPVENAFGEEWYQKNEILDNSFRYVEQSFSEKRKEIGEAFIKFVGEKFLFEKPFYYHEATGSGLRR